MPTAVSASSSGSPRSCSRPPSLRRGREIPFPHTAQRAERDGQGAGEEEDHIPHHAQPFQLVVGAAHQECQAARVPIPVGDGMPGRAMARTGLRMMPTFPSLPLKFRTAGFPQSGFKAGISGGAFPATTSSACCAVCLRPSCTPLPASYPRSEPRDAVRWHTSVQAAVPLYPRGPRSGPGYSVPVHPHLIGPIRPTRRHISISPKRLIRDALAVRLSLNA